MAPNFRNDPRSVHYFANAVAFAYINFPEEMEKDFIADVYCRVWDKVQEILYQNMCDGICNKYTIDVYQQSKLQAFWSFNQSEKIIKANIEEWIAAQNKKVCANEQKELFREIFADMFAVTVLGLNEAQYFDLINEFVDITPPLITNSINLLRIYAVSEASFSNAALMRWLKSGRCKYSNFDIKHAKFILHCMTALPLKEYIIQYAQSCRMNLQKKVGQKENKSSIERIRNIFNMVDDEKSISALWHFWWRSMA